MLVHRLTVLVAVCALAACSQSTPTPCERNEDCTKGLYCRFTAPESQCTKPQCEGSPAGGKGDCHCGVCTEPSTSEISCALGPAEGDPCDEAANKDYSCRRFSCSSYCLPQCTCYDGRWSCRDQYCIDANCRPAPDGGYFCPDCGSPPMCYRGCVKPD